MSIEEKAVIDRIVDGEHAVLLVGDTENEYVISADRLPKDAIPGSWLRVQIEDGEITEITVDADETEQVAKRIAEKMERLRKRKRRTQPSGE